MQRLTGIGVSPGVVAGRAVILIQREQVLRYHVPAGRLDHELERLQASRERARQQLTGIRTGVARAARTGHGVDFRRPDPDAGRSDAGAARRRSHPSSSGSTPSGRSSACSRNSAPSSTRSRIPYLRERKGDVADLVGRLKMNLRPGMATPRDLLRELDEASVLIADELTPSLVAQIDWTRVRGFATDAGSRTYHSAILARSLEVPAVVGLYDASRVIQPGQLVVIDGSASEVIVDPGDDVLARASRAAGRPHSGRAAPPTSGAARPSRADGVRIRLDANIEFPDDLAAARYAGAEGIGLFRSEFLLTRVTPEDAAADGDLGLSEDIQYEIYRGMLEGMAPGPGDRAHVRRGRRPVDAAAGRRLGGGRRTRGPTGPSRAAPEPGAPGAVPRPGARAAAGRRGTASFGSCFRSCREWSRSGGTAAGGRGGGRTRPCRAAAGARADRRDDRDSRGGLHGRPHCARGRLLHHRHERSDPGTASPSIARTRGCRTCTSRCTRPCCG